MRLRRLAGFLALHDVTQTDLAAAVGISRPTVSRLLNGVGFPRKPTLDAVLAFCRQHDPAVTYEQLFGAEQPTATASPEAAA